MISRLRSVGAVLLLTLLFGSLSAGAQTTPGAYVGHDVRGPTVEIEAENATAHITFYSDSVVRVDWTPPNTPRPDSSFAVVQDPDTHPPNVQTRDDAVWVRGSGMDVKVKTDPMHLQFVDANGNELTREQDTGFGYEDDGRMLQMHLDEATNVYGTGERAPTFNLRGQAFELYNTQHYGYDEAPSTMKINVPLAVTNSAYALFVDTISPAMFDIGASEEDVFDIEAEGGEITYYVIQGEDIPTQLEHYTGLTGTQPMPPKWAMGYIQSRFGYRTEAEAREVVETLLDRDFPLDAIILDLDWFEHMGDMDWDRDAFPEPFQMMRDFRDEGVKTLAITEPYMVTNARLFDNADQGGYLATDDEGDTYLIEDWWSCPDEITESEEGCQAGLLDFTNPAARDWWWGQHPIFMGDEMAALWTDLGEPENHPEGMRHRWGTAREVHNVYSLLWAQTLAEGYREWRPNDRFVNLTRAGSAGIQRYSPILWSGDVSRSFTGYQAQPPMLLNMSLSGLAYYSSDLGGFTGDLPDELYTRWFQHGTFTPTMRPHGNDSDLTEPTDFGTSKEQTLREYVQLRYRIMPYIYTLAYENYSTGMPLVRPLMFEDESLYNEDETYLFGDAFLVAPVWEQGQRERTVPLPEGSTWIDYWSGDAYAGGQSVTVDAPLSEMPLFVRAGSIIPKRPVASNVEEQPQDVLHLDVYPAPDQARHSASLYEDDGQTRDYETGAYAVTSLHQKQHTVDDDLVLDLKIGAAAGTYADQPEAREIETTVHAIADAPTSVNHNGSELTMQSSKSDWEANGGVYHDADAERLYIQIDDAPVDAAHTLRLHTPTVAPMPK